MYLVRIIVNNKETQWAYIKKQVLFEVPYGGPITQVNNGNLTRQ
jgi:hypothetical protein